MHRNVNFTKKKFFCESIMKPMIIKEKSKDADQQKVLKLATLRCICFVTFDCNDILLPNFFP